MTETTVEPGRLWRSWQKHTPFEGVVYMELVCADKEAGAATVRLPFKAEYRRSEKEPGYHGGVIATLIDVAGDFVVAIKCDAYGVPTINLRVDYLRMAGDGDLVAHAKVVRAGRTIAVVDVTVEDDDGRTVALGRVTYGTRGG